MIGKFLYVIDKNAYVKRSKDPYLLKNNAHLSSLAVIVKGESFWAYPLSYNYEKFNNKQNVSCNINDKNAVILTSCILPINKNYVKYAYSENGAPIKLDTKLLGKINKSFNNFLLNRTESLTNVSNLKTFIANENKIINKFINNEANKPNNQNINKLQRALSINLAQIKELQNNCYILKYCSDRLNYLKASLNSLIYQNNYDTITNVVSNVQKNLANNSSSIGDFSKNYLIDKLDKIKSILENKENKFNHPNYSNLEDLNEHLYLALNEIKRENLANIGKLLDKIRANDLISSINFKLLDIELNANTIKNNLETYAKLSDYRYNAKDISSSQKDVSKEYSL